MFKKFLAGLLATTVVIGCSNPMQPDSFAKKDFQPVSNAEKLLIADKKASGANNTFGLKLYSELLKTDKDKNIFISPLSIFFAMNMAYNGADNATKEAMAKALEVNNMSVEDLNKAGNILIRYLIHTDKDVRLEIANSLWPRKGIELNPEFKENNETFYKATVASLDYSSKDAVNIINGWVSENTQKKIEKIVDELDPDTLMVLINAIYFKGAWSEKFDKANTENKTFTLTDGKTVQHPLMNQYGKFPYYENDKFQAISLPYGENEKVSMYVFLPSKDSSLEDLHKDLNITNLEEWMTKFQSKSGSIALPKFKMEYEAELKEPLTSLGMGPAFDESKADFTKMFTPPTNGYISKVIHKTFVEVNEEGTEAAAATGVVIEPTSAPASPFEMIVDRPFLFMIRDSETGTVIFMGSVLKP